MKRRIISMLILLSLLLSLGVSAAAAETTEPADAVKEIWTVEDLMSMAEDPEGSYILMADLDLAGVQWQSIDFSGTFDGNGHAILNLTITGPGQEKPASYDGNRKQYETTYFGLFGTLRDAQVKNLQLLNVRALVVWDSPVFLAGIAGYAEKTVISGCTVTGTLELRAHDRMFGVGGVVGYGSGAVENCDVDVTLICTDTDAQTRDEQFLGGIYGTGFMDMRDCNVVIDGYVSDHGYVHSGGMVGMYMDYPFGKGVRGYVQGNSVEGKITFFEDNTNRRAYCKAIIGETLVDWWYLGENREDFLRDERFEYDVELRPEMCETPIYTQEITPSDCENFGYTTCTCTTCGYSYRDYYTLRVHEVTEWTIQKEPTVEEEGLSVGYCACGLEHTRVEPKLEPPTEAPTEPVTEAPATEAPVYEEIPVGVDPVFYIALGSWCVLLLLALILIVIIRKRSKHNRRRK